MLLTSRTVLPPTTTTTPLRPPLGHRKKLSNAHNRLQFIIPDAPPSNPFSPTANNPSTPIAATAATPVSIEAKLVILGSQAVGKTTLVNRFVNSRFTPASEVASTVGASFFTKRILDIDSGTIVRLQIWDTAGQERYRSMTRLYYRGANAAILCYDITSRESFDQVTHWLAEIRENLPADAILHLVGTKADLVAEQQDPQDCVSFESVVAFAAQHLYAANSPPSLASTSATTPAPQAAPTTQTSSTANTARNSMLSINGAAGAEFWGQEAGWDSCHEVSAETGEGVEEVFRVITRRLVEQKNARLSAAAGGLGGSGDYGLWTGSGPDYSGDYYDARGGSAGSGGGAATDENSNHALGGSFRLGMADKRRSWLGLPQFSSAATTDDGYDASNFVDIRPSGNLRSSCC